MNRVASLWVATAAIAIGFTTTAFGVEAKARAAPKESKLPRTHLDLTIAAKDGAQVPAKFWTVSTPQATTSASPSAKKRPVILAFHQAGASSDEYLPIAPRLVALGYDVLAIDQRVGGNAFGGKNAYAAAYTKKWSKEQRHRRGGPSAKKALKRAKGPPYLDAWPDMVGTLQWARAQGYSDVVVWGSSYSAAMAIKLGAAYPSVRAVLAFSPGEYLKRGLGGGSDVVEKAASVYPRFKGSPRVLVVTPPKERDRIQRIVAALGPRGSVFIPSGGVHGSSTLVLERCAVASTVWPLVERFLRESKIGRVK